MTNIKLQSIYAEETGEHPQYKRGQFTPHYTRWLEDKIKEIPIRQIEELRKYAGFASYHNPILWDALDVVYEWLENLK